MYCIDEAGQFLSISPQCGSQRSLGRRVFTGRQWLRISRRMHSEDAKHSKRQDENRLQTTVCCACSNNEEAECSVEHRFLSQAPHYGQVHPHQSFLALASPCEYLAARISVSFRLVASIYAWIDRTGAAHALGVGMPLPR